MEDISAFVALLIGSALIVAGVALIFLPAAFIVAGVLLTLVAVRMGLDAPHADESPETSA